MQNFLRGRIIPQQVHSLISAKKHYRKITINYTASLCISHAITLQILPEYSWAVPDND